ncbi:hypothetical protein APY94_05255 [Thermococcus celericrescens]|uniref:Uncharacterized protein n=1 Tax=Thermococcus celericrescens TaxID=227598 RepID=A0A117ITZ0_9EURY|nr:hypothetical protein [Thermococcus celericrescens]KUH33602.1 hypothetical protein APY94_05255 [Thermococcus celericrescens]
MRRLLYALPFLLFGLGLLFWQLTFTRTIVVFLGWLTFALEYRYGGESRENDELVALGISMSIVLMPLHEAIAEILALFTFILVMTALVIKFKTGT